MPEPPITLAHERRRPPNRRPILTALIEDVATGRWHLTVGFDGGRAVEIFLDAAHGAGSPLDALVHDCCIVISRDLLQCGRPPAELVRNLSDRPPSLFSRALTAAQELERAFIEGRRHGNGEEQITIETPPVAAAGLSPPDGG